MQTFSSLTSIQNLRVKGVMVQSGKPSYRLAVTAGLEYDPATLKPVEVNGETLRLENERATFDLNVRIQDYTGT